MSFSDTPMPGSSNNPAEELSAFDPRVFMNLLQHQVIQHQDLMMVIQVQQQEQQALMETFQIHLQNSAATSVPAPTPIITSLPNPTAKFPDPTVFTGKPSGVWTYVMEIESHFTLFPNQFNNDFTKMCHGMTSLPLLCPPLAASNPFHLHSAPTLKHTCATYATVSRPLSD